MLLLCTRKTDELKKSDFFFFLLNNKKGNNFLITDVHNLKFSENLCFLQRVILKLNKPKNFIRGYGLHGEFSWEEQES